MTTHKHNCFTRHYKNKFYDAMRSYGWDKFIWDEIYVAKELVKPQQSYTLTVMEDRFIQEYDSLNNGYNMTPGGGKFPDANGANNGMFNKNHTEESIALMRKNRAGKTVGANNGMYGKVRSEESKKYGPDHHMFGKTWTEDERKYIKQCIADTAKECPHCKKVVDKGNYNRWHGTNCKANSNAIQTEHNPAHWVSIASIRLVCQTEPFCHLQA
jgi:hypothetical protein